MVLLLLLLLLLLRLLMFRNIWRVLGYGNWQTMVVLTDLGHHLYVIIDLDSGRALDVTAGRHTQPYPHLAGRSGEELLFKLENVPVQRCTSFDRYAMIQCALRFIKHRSTDTVTTGNTSATEFGPTIGSPIRAAVTVCTVRLHADHVVDGGRGGVVHRFTLFTQQRIVFLHLFPVFVELLHQRHAFAANV
uniref:Putative secreted peptide n=1 Tax=Anopheles braziliensis TaxID=58242 RepID=A0A2M3ZNM4_9DIPT